MPLSFLVYDAIIKVYAAVIRIAVPFNPKARLWIKGRKNWNDYLRQHIPPRGVDLWMHCASLGEFEQGRPVLEGFRAKYPDRFILLSFFSPSGYEVRKNYAGADYICYLPLDTKQNARQFIQLIRPKLALFVKYEFWVHYISVLHQENIPLLLISAIFRRDQFFFKWYGKAFKQVLNYYDQIFVQDKSSAALLDKEGITKITISGDTRFDRVVAIAEKAKDFKEIEHFIQGKDAWIAGSTWPADEALIASVADSVSKWIIAPHEINEGHLLEMEKLFAGKTVRYSTLKTLSEDPVNKPILLIDNIGMLSSLYQYGITAYIGGGFGKGIHNVLEAAVWGVPVVFGPAFNKFKEAKDLVNLHGAFSIQDKTSLHSIIMKMKDHAARLNAGEVAAEYVRQEKGATALIMKYIMQLQNAS